MIYYYNEFEFVTIQNIIIY